MSATDPTRLRPWRDPTLRRTERERDEAIAERDAAIRGRDEALNSLYRANRLIEEARAERDHLRAILTEGQET